jgi:hypothetical protein
MATLFRRSGDTFCYRVTVPRGLRPYFRMVQIWRTLRTNDRDQTTLKSTQFTVHFQKLFLTLKKDGARMSPAEIDVLIERWLSSEVESLPRRQSGGLLRHG